MTASQPDYFVAINGVSGLDPSTDLGAPGRHGSASVLPRRPTGRDRPGAGTLRGAMGAAEDVSVVARGSGLRVPGPELDALVEDMRRCEALFEVTLAIPYYGQWKVAM
ncbi:hypothetical protein E2562_005550 [Oryza meyeriana var. granulata]|uniref:Uncharacterized protein n=1 Tax=Oryza meyeriana var. granulata TaxID=110450 RepID=A0A6G1F434_9ORYZ|nr:hypothetical protein E2562_005550 [Oryza meyeriana var. granulata]